MVKTTVFELLNSPKLISRKICLFEWQKCCNFHTVEWESPELTYPVSSVSVWHFWMKMQRKVKILVLSVSIENVCLQIFLTESSRWKYFSIYTLTKKIQIYFKIDFNPLQSNNIIFKKWKLFSKRPTFLKSKKWRVSSKKEA